MVKATPQARAAELFFKFFKQSPYLITAIKSAIICVEEILKDGEEEWNTIANEPYTSTTHSIYWNEVLEHIKKIKQ